MSAGRLSLLVEINRGKLLHWYYENESEANYLRMLRAVRADQQAEARKRRNSK